MAKINKKKYWYKGAKSKRAYVGFYDFARGNRYFYLMPADPSSKVKSQEFNSPRTAVKQGWVQK